MKWNEISCLICIFYYVICHHITTSLNFVGPKLFLFLFTPHSQSSHTITLTISLCHLSFSLSLAISVSLRWFADQYLLMSVFEHWASCTIAELRLIHTSVASSQQTDLTNYSFLRQGTVFAWIFFVVLFVFWLLLWYCECRSRTFRWFGGK